MPAHTQNSRGKIQQHRNRVDDLIRQNPIENQHATAAGDADAVAKLSANLAKLFEEKTRLFQFELTVYPVSGMPRSQAEDRLAQSAEEARSISKRAQKMTKVLDGTTRMADLITRLIRTFA